MTGPKRFHELFASAMIIVAVWIGVALLTAGDRYRVAVYGFSSAAHRPPVQLWHLLTYSELTTGLLWATLTPVIFYFAERLPLVRPFRWWNVVGVLAVTPLVASCRSVIAGAVWKFEEGSRDPNEFLDLVQKALRNRFPDDVVVTLVVVGVYNLLIAYRAAAASDRELLEARKQLANDAVQRLRGAIQPRFFFGALREVKAQICKSPSVADRMIVQLAAVLRKMLELERHAQVSLADEFDLVERCLRLEETRTGGHFEWRIAADESLLDARVPPLVLHTIVLGAMMVEGTGRGKLEINTWQATGVLSVSVTVDDPARSASDAVLEVTRARLRRLFGDDASFVTRSSSSTSAVVLRIPFVAGQQPHREPH